MTYTRREAKEVEGARLVPRAQGPGKYEALALAHPFDQYVVFRDGTILSLKNPDKPRKLRYKLRKGEYAQVCLSSQEGVRKNFYVHRLVCTAFHDVAPYPEAQVAHLNGDTTDNRAENLAWTSRARNLDDIAYHRALDLVTEADRKGIPLDELTPALRELVEGCVHYFIKNR